MRSALRTGWAAALLAAVVTIAVNSSYESQLLAGGHRLRDAAVIWITVGAFVAGAVGELLGVAFARTMRASAEAARDLRQRDPG